MSRAYSVDDILNKKFNLMPFEGQFKESIGQPELTGNWIVGGKSASGKTTFVFQLCKYLTRFDRVYYNSLEEGLRRTTQVVVKRVGMDEVKRRFIYTKEPIDDMIIRLKKPKSPGIVVVDSIQHAMLKKDQYLRVTRQFPNKLFIWVTHFKNGAPSGNTAEFAWYDADVKMTVEGFKMFADSRYLNGEPKPYIIWEEGAATYWGE